MIDSIIGENRQLPESVQELGAIVGTQATRLKCVSCGDWFGQHNVFTKAGWRETQISGFCEVCFDKLFEGDDDDATTN